MNTNHNKHEVLSFFDQNKVLIFSTLGVAVAIVLAIGLWQDHKSKRSTEAFNALYEAQSKAKPAIAQKNAPEAEKIFSEVTSNYSGTRAAFEAQLQVGDLYMDAGNFVEAAKGYEKAVALATDTFSKILSLYNVGIANESAKKFQEAVISYEDALKTQGSDFLKPELLMAQGRCYESLNQGDKAIAVYKTVEEKYPNRTYYSGAASAYEKQLKAKSI